MTGAFALALPFDTDSPEFVRGVEVGRMWERLMSGEPVEMTVHGSNAEMVLRMARASGRRLAVDNLNATWMRVTLL